MADPSVTRAIKKGAYQAPFLMTIGSALGQAA